MSEVAADEVEQLSLNNERSGTRKSKHVGRCCACVFLFCFFGGVHVMLFYEAEVTSAV